MGGWKMLQFVKQIFRTVLTVTALSALPFGTVVSESNSAESTANQPLRKVMIGYSAISPSQAPAWIAQDQGFFRKYGRVICASKQSARIRSRNGCRISQYDGLQVDRVP